MASESRWSRHDRRPPAMSPAWRWFIMVAVAVLFIFVAARVVSVW
jgi:hypothetical protein